MHVVFYVKGSVGTYFIDPDWLGGWGKKEKKGRQGWNEEVETKKRL
jgi:hypothetical protein